jgi:dethiobiotin synthetase
MKKYFITGTDTDIGKTFIIRLLLEKVKQAKMRALAIKPVAAGTIETPEGLKNEDAAWLAQESSLLLPYEIINPFLLSAPLSPHISAAREHVYLDAKKISAACKATYQYPVDYLFIEGAGGWHVPINDTQTMADVAEQLDIPVIVVVGLRLGCLNHALLTVDHILNKNIPIAGFVANQIQATPQEALAENIATLQQRINAPLLGVIPYSINKEIPALTDFITLP